MRGAKKQWERKSSWEERVAAVIIVILAVNVVNIDLSLFTT
jgi:hypothetical protein